YDAAAAAATISGRGSTQTANARIAMATLQLDLGQPATALVAAKRAFDDAGEIGPQPYTSVELMIRVHGRLGHASEVTKLEEENARRAKQLPSDRLRQALQHTHAGAMARDRHDSAAAIQELKQAESLARAGIPNAPLYFELGSAYLDAGNDTEAAGRFD